MRYHILISLTTLVLAACGADNRPSANGSGDSHNLSVDEMRRADIQSAAHFNKEWPAGPNSDGALQTKRGMHLSCRPQDSNRNWLVSCTGSVPNNAGGWRQLTVYCGYGEGKFAIAGCNDKDQN